MEWEASSPNQAMQIQRPFLFGNSVRKNELFVATTRVKIPNFSNFVKGKDEPYLSIPIQNNGFSWWLQVFMNNSDNERESLRFYLIVGNDKSRVWKCPTTFSFRVCSQSTFVRSVDSTEYSLCFNQTDYFYRCDLSLDRLNLVNENNGYVQNDTIQIELSIKVDLEQQEQFSVSNLASSERKNVEPTDLNVVENSSCQFPTRRRGETLIESIDRIYDYLTNPSIKSSKSEVKSNVPEKSQPIVIDLTSLDDSMEFETVPKKHKTNFMTTFPDLNENQRFYSDNSSSKTGSNKTLQEKGMTIRASKILKTHGNSLSTAPYPVVKHLNKCSRENSNDNILAAGSSRSNKPSHEHRPETSKARERAEYSHLNTNSVSQRSYSGNTSLKTGSDNSSENQHPITYTNECRPETSKTGERAEYSHLNTNSVSQRSYSGNTSLKTGSDKVLENPVKSSAIEYSQSNKPSNEFASSPSHKKNDQATPESNLSKTSKNECRHETSKTQQRRGTAEYSHLDTNSVTQRPYSRNTNLKTESDKASNGFTSSRSHEKSYQATPESLTNKCRGETSKNDNSTSQLSCSTDYYHSNKSIITEYVENTSITDLTKPTSLPDKHFNGLINQGATCYMNSVIQCLFFNTQFRRAIYSLPTEGQQPDKSIPMAFQRLFYDLQFGKKAASTRALTKAFGWTSSETYQQQDGHEFLSIVLDNLDSKMKGTQAEGTVDKLFKGKQTSYCRCINVDYEYTLDEEFRDIRVVVQDNKNLLEALDMYVRPQLLDDLYDAEEHGMQEAEQGVRFISFPPVLNIQLMRFNNDNYGMPYKVNDEFKFPARLNLNKYVQNSNEDYTYVLQAVLVHSGGVSGGHYFVYINTGLEDGNSQWYEFNDSSVTKSSARQAIKGNFGGQFSSGAYLLVYVQTNKIDQVLSEIKKEDIPQHLNQYREIKPQTCCKLVIVTDLDLALHHGFDIGDYASMQNANIGQIITVPTASTGNNVYESVAEHFNYFAKDIRLWKFDDVNNTFTNIYHRRSPSYRPCKLLTNNSNSCGFRANTSNIFYMKTRSFEDGIYLIFVKKYDAEKQKIEYVGSVFTRSYSAFSDIRNLIGCDFSTYLNFYLELDSNHVEKIKNKWNISFNHGSIVIVEDPNTIDSTNNLEIALSDLRNRIKIVVKPNEYFPTSIPNLAEDLVLDNLTLNSSLPHLCNEISKRVNHNADNILLWHKNIHFVEYSLSRNIRESNSIRDVVDKRLQDPFTFYYAKISVPVSSLSDCHRFELVLIDSKYEQKAINVFVPKKATVESIIEEAEKCFNFSTDGSGKLRLVKTSLNQARVLNTISNDTQISKLHKLVDSKKLFQLRVEEIPTNQLKVDENECILSVIHYDFKLEEPFGVGSTIKVSDCELGVDIKKRCRLLFLEEKERHRAEFALCQKNKILISDKEINYWQVDVKQLKQMSSNSAFYIAINHPDKSKNRDYAERGIRIYN